MTQVVFLVLDTPNKYICLLTISNLCFLSLPHIFYLTKDVIKVILNN